MAEIIDGRAVARSVEARASEKVESLKRRGIEPGLAVVLVGDDPASQVYVNMKKKACTRCGVRSEEVRLPDGTSEKELLSIVGELNHRKDIHGILVQLPLPKGIDSSRVIMAVDPSKDVDGFHPVNLGRLVSGLPGFVPCTPAGVMDLIHSTGVSVAGKECVVVGRSLIVGKPMSLLLLAENGTVTVCHSRTADLGGVCRRADILVAAVGRPAMITADMIKPDAVVIDVGVNRTDAGLIGDVDYEAASRVAGYITPVPGGVGPMTIARLMANTVLAAEQAL